MSISADQFRSGLRRWASGVSVVTTRSDGGIRGITVSSFCSLSLVPPLVLVCISKNAVSHRTIKEQGCFGINLLRDDQKRVADLAAGKSGEPGSSLPGAAWRTEVTGAPILEDCLGWLDCALAGEPDGGDHTIYVGRVEALGGGAGKPLLWFLSDYHSLGRPLSAASAIAIQGTGARPRPPAGRRAPAGRPPRKRRRH